MLQFLQPSSNAIQNMLIQQILTSPEQVYNSYDVTGQLIHIFISVFISLFISCLYFICLWSFVKPKISVFSYWDYEQYGLVSHFFSFALLSIVLWRLTRYTTNIAQDVDYSVRLWGRQEKKQYIKNRNEKERKLIIE